MVEPKVVSDEERLRQYKICKERGAHVKSGFMTASNPPMHQCKFCGTYFYYEALLREVGAPKENG